MDDYNFDELIEQAIENLPDEFKDALTNVAIVVKDEPDETDLQAAGITHQVSLFGLYQGVPLTKRSGAIISMPDKITIFKGPIIRARKDLSAIQHQVRLTILHEIGHYFGMTERQVRSIQMQLKSR